MSPRPLLEVKNLSKNFQLHHLEEKLSGTNNINFSVAGGDFLGIVGPSGSGKSTIIKCIYRSYRPSAGEILYDSRDFGQVDLATADERLMMILRRGEIGYVSQFLDIMPRVSSFDLVINELLNKGVSLDEAKDRAGEALKHFRIEESLWNQFPRTFSGGEKLRLNLARTIVKEPRLLLLDEPTASLDQASKEQVRDSIIKLKEAGTTLIGIFHDIEFMEGLITNLYNLEPTSE